MLLPSIPFIFQNYTREGCLRLDDEAVRITVSVRLGAWVWPSACLTTATVGLWLTDMIFTASCVETLQEWWSRLVHSMRQLVGF